jgi:hypothetical protein
LLYHLEHHYTPDGPARQVDGIADGSTVGGEGRREGVKVGERLVADSLLV